MLDIELFSEEFNDLASKSIYTSRFEIKSWLNSSIFQRQMISAAGPLS